MPLAFNKTPVAAFYIHRGAPKPIVMTVKPTAADPPRAFDGTVKMRIIPNGGTAIDLAEGSGITRSMAESVANACITVQLTVVQSRLIPAGDLTSFEMQEGTGDAERPILMGRLIGIGGDNVDV